MGFEFSEFIKLREQVVEFRKSSGQAHDRAARKIAQLFIRKVKKLTPVGETGDLRNNWKYHVAKKGQDYIILIYNQIEYASFVEDGHRIVVQGVTIGWVEGRFMMQMTESQMEKIAPVMWEKEVEKELKRIFGK